MRNILNSSILALQKKLVPNFIKFKLSNHQHKQMDLIFNKILKINFKDLYWNLSSIYEQLKYLHSELSYNVHHLIYAELLYNTQQYTMLNNYDRKRRLKLDALRKTHKLVRAASTKNTTLVIHFPQDAQI